MRLNVNSNGYGGILERSGFWKYFRLGPLQVQYSMCFLFLPYFNELINFVLERNLQNKIYRSLEIFFNLFFAFSVHSPLVRVLISRLT